MEPAARGCHPSYRDTEPWANRARKEGGEKSKEGSDSSLQTESIPQSQKQRQLKAHYQWALRAGSRVMLRQAKPVGQAVPTVEGFVLLDFVCCALS